METRISCHAESTRIRLLGWLALGLWVSGVFAAGDHVVEEEQFADYRTAHNVIKCPYLPAGLKTKIECAGRPVTCLGTPGHDLILGSEDGDVIVAGRGNDSVHGDAGSDVICGGQGNDALFGARGDDEIRGGPGDDRLFGGPGGFDSLWEGPGRGYVNDGPGDFDVCLL